jgi:hypothetical protein
MMSHQHRDLRPVTSIQFERLKLNAAAITLLSVGILVGCSHGPSAVSLPSVDGSDVAAFAMEHYDIDHNGAIDAAEIAKCPPLKIALANYDADKNGQLTAQEIEDRIDRLFRTGNALTGVDCTVTVEGRPLQGATVKFRPVEMLGSSVKPAQGLTNASGTARLALAEEDLPADLKGTPLAHPGLYHVEVTHPKVALQARYNTNTELGFEVDPSNDRTGTSSRFDLKSK